MRFAILVSLAALLVSACANTPERSPAQLSGAEMYQQLCSSCHGVSGHGDGPVASLIKIGVPDLTRIAHREGGEFPTEDVRRTIEPKKNKHDSTSQKDDGAAAASTDEVPAP